MRPITVALALLVAALGFGFWWSSFVTAPAPGVAGDADTSTRVDIQEALDALQQPSADVERAAVEGLPIAATAVPSSEPSPEELWGRVVSAATGEPIAGADVTLLHRDADEFWNLDLDYGKRVAEVGRAKSAADGRFRFNVPRASQHKLVVRAGGFATRTLPNLTGGSEVLAELSPGATVTGVVRSGGEGLVNIPVAINVVGESIKLASGRTSAGGEFVFTGLQPASVFVQVKSLTHSEKWQRLVLEPGGMHRVEVDLDVGKAVHGRVVDAVTGTAIVDAELSDSWTFTRIARTGIDGRFILQGVEDNGFVSIQVRARGYATAFANVSDKLDEPVEFRLVSGGQVTGRLVSESGEPVPVAYAAVAANYMEGPGMQGCDWIRAEVGIDGRFAALALRPELHYWLYVRAPGCGTRVYALPRKLESGERHDVGDLVFRPAGGVEGRVVDDSGEPIARVSVSIRGNNNDSKLWLAAGVAPAPVSQFRSRSTKSDGRGDFRFAGVSAGSYSLSVRPKGHSQAVTREVVAIDGEIAADIQIVVPKGLTIEGTLCFAGGRAHGDVAANMRLSATDADHRSSSAQVHADGHFVFHGLTSASYTISIHNCPDGWSLAPRIDVMAGTSDLRLLFEPAALLTGQVLNVQGKGTKARVWARPDGSTGGSALIMTDDEGRFRIEVPPSFRGSIGAHDIGEWQQQVRVENVVAGQSDLVLQLAEKMGPGRGRR